MIPVAEGERKGEMNFDKIKKDKTGIANRHYFTFKRTSLFISRQLRIGIEKFKGNIWV
jgi:hypothetical protein